MLCIRPEGKMTTSYNSHAILGVILVGWVTFLVPSPPLKLFEAHVLITWGAERATQMAPLRSLTRGQPPEPQGPARGDHKVPA